MKPYTVLVARPDYVSDDQLGDLFRAHVESDSPTLAAKLGAHEAWYSDSDNGDDEDIRVDDYRVIAIFEGHLDDVNPF